MIFMYLIQKRESYKNLCKKEQSRLSGDHNEENNLNSQKFKENNDKCVKEKMDIFKTNIETYNQNKEMLQHVLKSSIVSILFIRYIYIHIIWIK